MNSWTFAVVNGKLAEIFFENDNKNRKSKIFGHCYVKEDEYMTKYERLWIKKDTAKYRLSYRKGEYRFND